MCSLNTREQVIQVWARVPTNGTKVLATTKLCIKLKSFCISGEVDEKLHLRLFRIRACTLNDSIDSVGAPIVIKIFAVELKVGHGLNTGQIEVQWYLG